MKPTYEEIMLPLLNSLEDREEYELNGIIDKLAKSFRFSCSEPVGELEKLFRFWAGDVTV